MGKKRSDRGAEGTGCRPGDPHGDSERSRAWEVDLVARCWLICHCAYVPGPGPGSPIELIYAGLERSELASASAKQK